MLERIRAITRALIMEALTFMSVGSRTGRSLDEWFMHLRAHLRTN